MEPNPWPLTRKEYMRHRFPYYMVLVVLLVCVTALCFIAIDNYFEPFLKADAGQTTTQPK